MTAEPGVAAPPAAARIPAERTHHGDTVTDEYSWLAGKENPETIAFLDAENAYTQAMTAGQAPLRDAIFGEIRARTQETDLSVPARKGDWWYYTRTVEGQQYALHCRRAVRPDDTGPPGAGDGGPRDGGGGLAGRGLAGRRGDPARRERAGRRRGVLLAGGLQREPRRAAARLLHRLRRE